MSEKQNNAGYIARLISSSIVNADVIPGTVQVDIKGHFITVLDKSNDTIYRVSVTLEA